MRFLEPIAGQAVKEAFTRLGYRSNPPLDWDEDVFVCLLYLLSGKLLCNPTLSLVLTKSSSVLSTRVGLSLRFTVHKTVVGSSHL